LVLGSEVILTGKEKKACAIATLTNTDSILTALGTNPAFYVEWLVTACTIAWLANG